MRNLDETRVMAIDYGRKRIGIALSDPLKNFSYPHTTFSNDKDLLRKLKSLIEEKNIDMIILGIPDEKFDSEFSVVEEIKKFKERVERTFSINVILWDESFTSIIAQERIFESVKGKHKRRNKSLVDMHSASIILQEYLDQKKRSTSN